MMKKLIFLLCLVAGQLAAQPKELPAYLLYRDGKKTSWNELVKAAVKSDIVFFGEFHNNPIHHWLQYELTKELHSQKNGQIVLGAEMFEADNQLLLNEYLQGLIRERNFMDEARLWPNYKTDYKPLVEFAKEKSLRFIATNVPRRYAAAVSQGGFEALEKFEAQARLYLPPFPIPFDPELPGYAAFQEMGGMGGKSGSWENFAKAQALKDATMAWFIINNIQPGYILLHFNGAYHTDNNEGILWFIRQYASHSTMGKGLKILTISCEEVDNIDTAVPANKADFMIVTPSSMTKTH